MWEARWEVFLFTWNSSIHKSATSIIQRFCITKKRDTQGNTKDWIQKTCTAECRYKMCMGNGYSGKQKKWWSTINSIFFYKGNTVHFSTKVKTIEYTRKCQIKGKYGKIQGESYTKGQSFIFFRRAHLRQLIYWMPLWAAAVQHWKC